MEVAVEKTNAPKSLVIAITMALLAGAIGFFVVDGKESDQARADKGVTTETTLAGAQVTPPEPKLRVEPNRHLIHRKDILNARKLAHRLYVRDISADGRGVV
jgi:hypothetical protein